MQTLNLQNSTLSLSLVPALGGKVVSFKQATGEEWIWDQLFADEFETPGENSPYDTTNFGGIDDCIPTIGEMVYKGAFYPDHGEIWRYPTEITHQAQESVTTEIRLRAIPLYFRRTIELCGNEAIFSYHVLNEGKEPVDYLWAFHPLFRLALGDRMEVGSSVTPLRLGGFVGLEGAESRKIFPLPQFHRELNLHGELADSSQSYCAKLFFKAKGSSTVSLSRPSGERLTLHFNASECPYLGIWITNKSYQGHTIIAFEPTNYPSDAIGEFAPPVTLKAGESREWQIRISLS